MIRRNTFSYDSTGNGHELVVDIVDTQSVDLPANFFHEFGAAIRFYICFQI